jgi:ABC-2 type transport system ATP-binding protein
VSTAPPLVVRELSRSYGEFEALRALDFQIEAGRCTALIGHNGSGKTTAVRLIAGLLEPSGGVIEVAGVPMHPHAASLEARMAIAVVPDTPMLYPDLTVGEHLELVALGGEAGLPVTGHAPEGVARLRTDPSLPAAGAR